MSTGEKLFKNQINIESGFHITGNYPIDDRLVVTSKEYLDKLTELRESYEGMIVSVIGDEIDSNNGTYQCLNNTWHRLLTDSNFVDDYDILTKDNYDDLTKKRILTIDTLTDRHTTVLTSGTYQERAENILNDTDVLILGGFTASIDDDTVIKILNTYYNPNDEDHKNINFGQRKENEESNEDN